MSSKEPENRPSAKKQLGILFQPKNLVKTVASQVPLASAGVEMLNQIHGERVEHRLTQAEEEIRAMAKRHELERISSQPVPQFRDWSLSVSEYISRSADLAVAYDAGFHSRAERGREFLQIVAHGCLIGGDEILTCKEAIETAFNTADHKHGTVVIMHGMARYAFASEAVDKPSGLCLCRKTKRDEKSWKMLQDIWREKKLDEPSERLPPSPIKSTVMPWIGQEAGFLHAGEAEDIFMRTDAYSHLQFDSTVISHFRKVKDDSLKSFVSGVLPGRVLRAGSAVFARDGTLLGIVSGTESYASDAGRRAVVRSLLGHPRFKDQYPPSS